MLLYFFITCFSFIFFAKSLPLKPLPPWASEMRLLPLCFWKDLFLFSSIRNFLSQVFRVVKAHSRVSMIRSLSLNYAKIDKNVSDESGGGGGLSLLDLPELALDNILEKLPPEGLCTMSGVCASLRERCTSDHLWERHMKQKWGRVIGPAAYREWQWYRASRKNSGSFKENKINGFKRLVSMFWPSCWVSSPKVDNIRASISLPVNSIVSCYPCYLALETGKFWFPAQVYNRENGHVGFMLSCYDAELSYDPCTDAFEARYPPHGRRPVAMESSVPWERLRAAPIDNSSHDLYSSDCLNDLLPGDHIEIQWRKNKEFPYGWWYGVVGHLEPCDGNEHFCQCHNSDSVVLEFHQYAPGSRWRRTTVSRKDHQEEGDERDGFYGGIRKLYNNEEIAKWRLLWPAEILE